MSDVTQIVNDQRNVNETSKSFDSVESVHSRGRPPINSNERQFLSQDPINPAARFRPSVELNQFQLWRQPPPTGRPPLGYPPPNRFAPRNANEPRPFPPRNPIPPLRTQEFQNRRSFEKPERPYDVDLSPVENRLRPNSPWQRVRERLPLQSANHQSDMESTQMKINAFEDAMNREMNKDRIPPFRRDSIVNADSRPKPQLEKRFSDEEESYRKNRPGDLPFNQSNDLRKPSIIPGEFARREGPPDPRIYDPNSQHRPSLTQLQMNETNYINDRGQPNAPPKARPLQAVPEYENRNYITRNDDERLREDQNRNYRQDSYSRDYRKIGDFENINKENRKFPNRSEDELSDETRSMTKKFSQRSFDNGRENYNSRYDADMNYDSVRGKNEIPFNRIDVNGVSDKNALTRVNDNKTVLDKKPTANGDIKPPSSLPELKKEKSALKTPTKKISPKSPEIGSANSLGDKKKVPMNKVQVGSAPSPNLKVVRSKIGSLENYTHKPGGGKVKIENRKLEWKVQPRIEAKNDKYAPSGGDKKITQVKLQWSAKSKIGSLENATHKPGGGDKKIESVKLDFKDKAKPKVGSKDNIKHVAGGGTVKKTTDVDVKSTSSNIEDQKLDIKAQSKVGSLDNVKHRPGGGDKKIFDDKEYLKQTTLTNESSKANSVTTSGSQAPEDPQICSRDSQQKEKQPAAADAITPKKSDKPAKDQVKPKNEPKSPKSDKKSQPSTPKQSFSAENKPTSLISTGISHPEKITPKSDTKVHEEKIDQKPKTDSMPELKPELKKIPSKDKIKTDNFKSKVPTTQPRELVKIPSKDELKEEINLKDDKQISATQTQIKQNLDSVSKLDGKKLPDVSISGGENLTENKSQQSKDDVRNENNNKIEIATVNKKSSDVQVPKSEIESKSIPAIKPPVEVIILKKQNSKSKIEPKSNITDTSKKEEKKESNIQNLKLDNVENKSNISNSSVKDQIKSKDPIDPNKSSVSKSTIVEDPKKDSNNPNLKSSIEKETNKSKDQSKLSANVPKEKNTNENSNPNNENKLSKINEQIKTPSNLNSNESKLSTNAPKENSSNENKLIKMDEQIKTLQNNLNSKSDYEKSKLPKIENTQKDNVIQDMKSNSIKPSPLEINKTSETFSRISSKAAVETKPADSTLRTAAESKISNISVHDEKLPSLNQTENQSKISATSEKIEPVEEKKLEISSSATSQNQQVPSVPSTTLGSK